MGYENSCERELQRTDSRVPASENLMVSGFSIFPISFC